MIFRDGPFERLTQFLVSHGYRRCGVDKTLFIKRIKKDIIIAQVHVDDIVFGSTSNSEVQEFFHQMKDKFEMSMVLGKLIQDLYLFSCISNIKQINTR